MPETLVGGGSFVAAEVLEQAARRRTFAIISHPDAGKSTLTEALALHAGLISEAGAIHGKASRKSTVSDWTEMEKDRGISITSAALQFEHRGCVINLLDTPGHADFSEDTYRVLAAVDCAVMLIDAAKGIEAQTLKLFEVCKHRGIPIITVVNKWDRPGADALELMDEIVATIGMTPKPLNWPVGAAGDFRGVVDRDTGEFVRFTRTAGGATIAPQTRMSPDAALAETGQVWAKAFEEHELLDIDGANYDRSAFLAGTDTPVLFAAAALNFGVAQVLDVLIEKAPAPAAVADADGEPRPLESAFSAMVFKVQAGMNQAHRDRVAFARVCSGQFDRGMQLTDAGSGRTFATKYVHTVVGNQRHTIEYAFPGDVIGLVNAGSLRAGDTLYQNDPVAFPQMPRFAPEHFATARVRDRSRTKRFTKGIAALDNEGVVQVLMSDVRGEQTPVLAAVGPLQFEVAAHRMESDFNAEIVLDSLPYRLARRVSPSHAADVAAYPQVEVFERSDGVLLALFADKWRLQRVERDLPDAGLEPLVG
ncbi:MAG: peptide chain release factor 3 [Actinomycetes bacterium]